MGQATQATTAAVDLPDPMEPGAGPAVGPTSGVGADDLLAQLAGDEIDRLLAEAEVDRPPAGPAGPPARPRTAKPPREAAAPQPVNITPAPKSPDDALLPSDPFTPAGPGAATTGNAFAPTAPADGTILPSQPTIDLSADGTLVAAPPAGAVTPELSRELDAVFANLDGGRPTPTPTPVLDQLTPGLFPRISSAAPAAELPAEVEEADTSAAERAALDAEIEEAATEVVDAAALARDSAEASPAEADDRPSLLVRLLEWINAPLAACSDSTRELVGKIAVVTLVNAIAVLVYVLVFR